MFVESFQGQYKDGTNGTPDFIMVSALFLILRVLTLASFMNRNYYSSLGQTILLISVTCFYAIARPYKLNSMTNADIVVLVLLELFSLATNNPSKTFLIYFRTMLVSALLLYVPHMALIFYIFYMLAKKVGIAQYLQVKYETLTACMQMKGHTDEAEADMEAMLDTGSLPDRLINPGEYEPVLLTTEEHTTTEIEEDAVHDNPRRLTPVYTYGSFNNNSS